MDFKSTDSFLGDVRVMTTSHRGFTPEEIADRALDRIISVGNNVDPVLREQANAYREDLRKILVYYLHEAVRSHNVTLVSKFKKMGYPELIPILDA